MTEQSEINFVETLNQTRPVETILESSAVEESQDLREEFVQNNEPTQTKPSIEIDESVAEVIVNDIDRINQPRKPQRIRRRRKSTVTRTSPRNQQGIQAAVENAQIAKDFVDIESSHTNPRTTFSNSLEAYENRQNKAVESMRVKSSAKNDSSLYDATRQQVNNQEFNLPDTPLPKRPLESLKGRQPINTPTKLTPLLARPGVSSSPQPKEAIRESASRQQTESPIEMKLSAWDIEDRARLKKELDGAKK